MEPFKHRLDAQLVHRAGLELRRAWPAFDRVRFERIALEALDALELKARAHRIADALEATLPPRFADAAEVIDRSLAPALDAEQGLSEVVLDGRGLAGWVIWPLTEFVARRGLDDPVRALQSLHALTQRFTAEWAIRPFIERHPALCFETLQRWTGDPSAHVRRLVSEGSRPRLPWGQQLKPLIADPSPTLPLLAALLDDPSAYVRRSVANHLNDIAKDHPQLVIDWVGARLRGASAERRSTLRHACRTLIKQGHPQALALWGAHAAFDGHTRLRLSPRRIHLGDSLILDVSLRAGPGEAQTLIVDYDVRGPGQGTTGKPKVFKGWQLTLAAGELRTLRKRHPVRPVSVRRYQEGRHVVELLINGEVAARAAFELRLD
jgi:3-methyladenine DNA glycosylase AlkC